MADWGARVKAKFVENNWANLRLKIMFIWRAVAVFTTISCGISNSIYGWAVQKAEVDCITDLGFSTTSSANEYFVENSSVRDNFLIIASVLSDFLFICFAFRFVFWGNTTRPIVFFILFYSLAGVVQLTFRLKTPEGYCWENPGVPSLLLTYSTSSTIYYSIISGTLMFFCMENWKLRNFYLFGIGVFTCTYVSVLMILMRADYSASVIGGITMANYFWLVSGEISEKLDFWLKFKEKVADT